MYKLLPFAFERIKTKYFLSNIVGEFCFLSFEAFHEFVQHKLSFNSPLYKDLKAKHFLADDDINMPIKMLAIKYRTKKSFLKGFTSLHMIVPTLRCNSDCVYCQVTSRDIKEKQFNMDEATAKKVVETIFKGPARHIKIEFQGGEPLMNFPIVRFIIDYSKQLNKIFNKEVQYVICSNLTLMDNAILVYLKKNNVYVSTSLDGPKNIHDLNRPLRNGKSSYDLFIEKLGMAKAVLGNNKISALMTTTNNSLSNYIDIINEYLKQGFNYIFLRSLNPYGKVIQNRNNIEYDLEAFVAAYKKALNYIIEINLRGTYFIEGYASLLLKRILTPFSTGFVDLQSPAGTGISGVIYNYNGNVYASDEGRMLAEMGDDKFLMGNVTSNTYEELFHSDYLINLIKDSCLESLPVCATCAYMPYCGADPVRNYVEYGDVKGYGGKTKSCQKNKSVIQYIFELIDGQNDSVLDVFWSWITKSPSQTVRIIGKSI